MGKKGKKTKKQLEEELLKAQEDLVEREAVEAEQAEADEKKRKEAEDAETLRLERLAKEETDRLAAEGEPVSNYDGIKYLLSVRNRLNFGIPIESDF